MNRFALQCLRTIAVFAIVGIVCGAIWGLGNGLMAFLALLSLWLFAHLWQIGQLITWLERPKPSTIPTGLGIWQQIFNTLMLQAKSRKRRKQKITQALQRFYHASEVMPDGVMILNQEGRIEWMNSVAREHFLLQIDDLGGILANLVRQPEFHHFMTDDASQHEVKLHLPTRKGLPRTVIVKRTPFDKHLQLLVSQDITPMEKLNQTRSDFIANVSHELRTPLTVINGFVETMQDLPNLPADKREQFLALMKKDSDRMLTLLDDLLTLSRLENFDPTHKLQPINLSALVEQLSQEGMTLSGGKQTFDTVIEPNLWITRGAIGFVQCLEQFGIQRGALQSRRWPHRHPLAQQRQCGQCPLQRNRQWPWHRCRTHPPPDRTLLPRGCRTLTRQWRHRFGLGDYQTCLGRAWQPLGGGIHRGQGQ